MDRSLAVSFECFPPKTLEGTHNLHQAAFELSQCHPEFFSVTFGAGGSTRDGTIATVKTLQRITNKEVVPHLSCIGSSRDQLVEILNTYQSLGVKRIVALRGDLPSGMGQAGEFRFANELVALVREVTGDHFHIDVAAYPEIHPQTRGVADDILNLKRKYEAGANSAITQYFFNPDAYFYYLEDCARHGITMPIIPGIMPIVQFSKLSRFSTMCGAEIPLWIRKRLESFGDDSESIQAFGLEVIYNLCQRLVNGGAPGLHFYTLNRAETAVKIIKMLGFSLSSRKVP